MIKALKHQYLLNVTIPAWAKLLCANIRIRTQDTSPVVVEKKPFGLIVEDIMQVKVKQYRMCVVHGDLKSLLMYGEATDEDLDNAFMNILSQFYQIKKDKHIKEYIDARLEIERKKLHINRVSSVVEALRGNYDEALINELREDGYNYFAYSVKTIDKDLNRVLSHEKKHVRRHDFLVEQFNLKYGENTSKGIMTDDDFMTAFNTIAKYCKYQTDIVQLEQDMSLYSYAIDCKNYDQHLEYLESLNKPTV